MRMISKLDGGTEEARSEARRLLRGWRGGKRAEVVNSIRAAVAAQEFVALVALHLADMMDAGERGDLIHALEEP